MNPSPASSVVPPPVDPRDEFLTKKELAARLKVTVRTIENWQRDGLLSCIKISSHVLFNWPEVVEHLKTNFQVCRHGAIRPSLGDSTINNESDPKANL